MLREEWRGRWAVVAMRVTRSPGNVWRARDHHLPVRRPAQPTQADPSAPGRPRLPASSLVTTRVITCHLPPPLTNPSHHTLCPLHQPSPLTSPSMKHPSFFTSKSSQRHHPSPPTSSALSHRLLLFPSSSSSVTVIPTASTVTLVRHPSLLTRQNRLRQHPDPSPYLPLHLPLRS